MKKKIIISILLLLSLSISVFLLKSTSKHLVIPDITIEKPSVADGTISQSASSKNKTQEKQDPIDQKEDYILECPGEFPNNISESDIEKYSEPGYFEKSFEGNKEITSQIAYALRAVSTKGIFEEGKIDHEDPIALLSQQVNDKPDMPLLHYFLVSECNENPDSPRCSNNVISNATSNDPNNGALWFQIAVIEARKNSVNNLIYALEQLIAAPIFNEYWAESIEIFDNALQASGLSQDGPRIVTSIGYAVALGSGPISELFEACKKHSVARADIAQLCIDAGEKMSIHAQTIINQSLGYALQVETYRAIEDYKNEAATLELKKSKIRMLRAPMKINKLMLFDDELARYWFTQLKLFGEKKSFQLVYDEAIRLSSNPDYNPCN